MHTEYQQETQWRGLCLSDPAHCLHPAYSLLVARLLQLGPLPGLLGEEDVQRAAAQVLLEACMADMSAIIGVGILDEGVLVAWQYASAAGVCSIRVDIRQATAYSVAETTKALDALRLRHPSAIAAGISHGTWSSFLRDAAMNEVVVA